MVSHFKFVADVNHLSSILSGNVKFTKIEDLNDPSELVPYFNRERYETSLRDLREHGYTGEALEALRKAEILLKTLCPEYIEIGAPRSLSEADDIIQMPNYDNIKFMQERLCKLAECISENVGVLCLTLGFSSLPMWAHYAANAQGLVVEYVDLQDVFTGDETGVLNCLRPVEYNRDTQAITFDPRTYNLLFLSKLPDWQYEREVRIIQALTVCDQLDLDDGTSILTKKIAPSYIGSVTMGWNMTQDDRKTVTTAVEKLRTEVNLYEARFDGAGLTRSLLDTN